MSDKTVLFTLHAETVIKHRQLRRDWIERVARTPEWVEKTDDETERRFSAVADMDGRVLRVVCVDSPTEIRIITAFFDRNARRPT